MDASRKTCPDDSPDSEIKVGKAAPPGVDPKLWFPIWNRDVAGEHSGKYWLAADIWVTTNTDFTLSVDNVTFFRNETEWNMPLNGPPPNVAPSPKERTMPIVV